jgi:5-(carboxyamino)imidazole ribonucleotide mutase
MAAAVLALSDPELAKRLEEWRARQTAAVGERPDENG